MIAHICFGVLESGDVAMDEALSTNSTKHKTQNEIFCPSVVVLCREKFFATLPVPRLRGLTSVCITYPTIGPQLNK